MLDSAHMWRRFRLPVGAIATLLLVLIGVLAVLQYRWLGQISDAERTERRGTLAAGAREFALDFDRELARAYLLFQGEPPLAAGDQEAREQDLSARFAARYDHWQANSRFPKLLKEVYAFTQAPDGTPTLRRFDLASRQLVAAEWPAAMADWRKHLDSPAPETTPGRETLVVRRIPPAIWESVPALVVPSPIIHFTTGVSSWTTAIDVTHEARRSGRGALAPQLDLPNAIGYSVLVLDAAYIAEEMLPALARRHFLQEGEVAADSQDFRIAVVARDRQAPLFQSTSSFAPAFDATTDAAADLFQVRTQDFTQLVAEVRRFTTFTAMATPPAGSNTSIGRYVASEGRPLSIVIQQSATGPRGGPGATSTSATRMTTGPAPPLWRVLVSHRSGSLEAAVAAARRRNLVVSFSILGVLGASMGLLVLTTRRAQRLARQQMEFVATVSHELRTPLAVIRSAADNLADGVIDDEQRIRRYGELMRTEGRRLTEMVEQILEFAGIESGQRGLVLRPVPIRPLIDEILASSAPLIERAGIEVEIDVPPAIPATLGDEPALRRVFQNLVDNAIKYGGSGGWMRISARQQGRDVLVTIADRGIGIDPAEQSRIFEPFYRAADVVAAQMQGAGLGLSLVQRIVAAHGGRVTVNSTPRQGAEFTVQLPASDDAAAERAPAAAGDAIAPDQASPRYS